MNKTDKIKSKWNRGGRPPKTDPATYRYSVNFNAVEHACFLTMYEQSGVHSKASFIKARVFNEKFRVVKTDRSTLEYVTKLTTLYAQFRSIGVNYNQAVKALNTHFTEQTALVHLYKLEKITMELIKTNMQIIELTEELKRRLH